MNELQYRAHPALSQSDLSWLFKSPTHFEHRNILKGDTEAKAFGRAAHESLFTPLQFKDTYKVMPEFTGLTQKGEVSTKSKEAKDKKNKWLLDNPGILAIDADDMDRLTGMLLALSKDPTIQREELIIGGQAEGVMLFNHRGHACKGRFDYFRANHPKYGRLLIEYKTALDASKEAFARTVNNRHYDFQLAYYDLELHWDTAISIVQEKFFPYAIGIYNMQSWKELGAQKVERAFDLYESCVTRKHFHGYTDGIEDCLPASWLVALNKEEITYG